ncbi:MAG: ATP-binding cassette domain-containing protein [Mycoplasma sp.]
MIFRDKLYKYIKSTSLTKKESPRETDQLLIHDNANKTPIIKINNMKKSFSKKKVILKDFNLTINELETTCILGHNGCGKTTLVELILGITKPTSGTIEVTQDKKYGGDLIGVQFQDISFPQGLNVWNLIQFNVGISQRRVSDRQLNEMITAFNLKDFLKTHITKLSGGQQQRLNVLLSLINLPKIVILDEYTTGLDISSKSEITKFIKNFCMFNKVTLILVSHDIEIIDILADRIVIIDNKKVWADLSHQQAIEKFGTINKFLNEYIR